MAEAIQCLSGAEQLKGFHIFGVRHLSPASAYHLLAYLNQLRPKCVLIEGPSDCDGVLAHIADKRVKPPIALLAYTTQLPIQTILYPFASYSPEYQAICWAIDHNAKVRFIDLPAAVTLSRDMRQQEDISQDETDENAEEETIEAQHGISGRNSEYYHAQSKFYGDLAAMSGEHDYETFWERQFEHCLQTDIFIEKISAFSQTMRESLEGLQWETEKRDAAYNYVRETYMKRQIEQAVKQGYRPDEIVVVTGAYHVRGLMDKALPPMTDEECRKLPMTDIKMTLMPYSYYRLSSKSGYGAGNKAPAYFQLMWECIQQGDLERLAPLYLSSVGEAARSGGNYTSTANVIEAVRLSQNLAHMHEGVYPTLKDMRDSAVCLLGGGELSAVSEAVMRIDIGTAIGELPEGVSQTPVQDDMNRQLKRLKLEKYKTVVAQDITLDLRENRKVKSREAAYIDLNRSVFFNRLQLLGISFVTFQGGASSAWGEKWVLRWSPENEIEVVETTLKGETIETAAAFVLKEQFESAGSILEIAKLMSKAFLCHLLSEVPDGLRRLQTLCVEGENFVEAAQTALEIAMIMKYRDIRNVDTTELIPILKQVFLRAALVMFDGAACDDDAAKEFINAVDAMHIVSQDQFEHINDELWLKKLRELADSDNRNVKISGTATAILMERNEVTDDALRIEVARRLSYGVPGDLAALWFEGLSARNRYVLLSRVGIWKQLDDYLETLDVNEFRRALVFLRRAFGSFEAGEKNSITDILADVWNVETTQIGEFLQEELSQEEQNKLDELNSFEFDF